MAAHVEERHHVDYDSLTPPRLTIVKTVHGRGCRCRHEEVPGDDDFPGLYL